MSLVDKIQGLEKGYWNYIYPSFHSQNLTKRNRFKKLVGSRVLTPGSIALNVTSSVVDGALGLIAGAFNMLTLGKIEKLNRFTWEQLGAGSNMVREIFVRVILFLNPNAKLNSENSRMHNEFDKTNAAKKYWKNSMKGSTIKNRLLSGYFDENKVWKGLRGRVHNLEYSGKFIKEQIAARIGHLALLILSTMCNALDLSIGLVGAAGSVLLLGRCQWMNEHALDHLRGGSQLINDILIYTTKILRPKTEAPEVIYHSGAEEIPWDDLSEVIYYPEAKEESLGEYYDTGGIF